MTDDTYPKLLLKQYKKYGDTRVALRQKDRGIWKNYTWKDFYEKVKFFSLGLIDMGLERGDRVAILGENQPEWYFADLATQAVGGVVVGVFTDCMPGEIRHYVSHSDAKFIIAQDQEQVDKVLEIAQTLPALKNIIYWDIKGLWFYRDPLLINYDSILEIGRRYNEQHPGLFEENVQKVRGDDIALMLFTSGTTGLPKAAMVSYDNVLTLAMVQASEDQVRDSDDYVSAISPAWITEHGAMAMQLSTGGPIHFPESPETVQSDIREISPETLFFSARQLETIARTIQARMVDTHPLKRFAYDLFLPVAFKRVNTEIAGNKMSTFWQTVYAIGNFIVYRNLLDKFGMAKAKRVYSGGAAVSPDILKFFRGIGVNVKMGYGSSEGGGGTGQRDNDIKPETAGTPWFGVELKLKDDGELLVRGPGVFRGYWKNPEATEKAVKDGWYRTGDFCHIDEDGHLTIMGRMVDVRGLSNGKRFSPDYSEVRLRYSAYLKDALVFGRDSESYVVAIVNIDRETVGRWAESKHIAYTTFADLSQKSEVISLISKEIEKVNRALPDHARIRKFVSLSKEFDPDESELTRTRKLRRSYVETRFKDIIDGMYSGKAEIRVESEITYRDGRKAMVETSLKVRSID